MKWLYFKSLYEEVFNIKTVTNIKDKKSLDS